MKVAKTALCVAGVLLAAVFAVSAWYTMMNKLTRTKEQEIDMPPIIFIKDDNLQEITSFHLDGLKIGEEYNAVFCVSPAVLGSVDNFFLGVIYTENLGMNISLYPVSSVTEAEQAGKEYVMREITAAGGGKTTCYFNFSKLQDGGSDIDGYTHTVTYGDWVNETPLGPGNLNTGVYKAYRNLRFSDTQKPSASLIDELNDKRQYRFFILNITWTENAGTENAKETDIVYIVSKGTRKKNV